MMKGWLAVPLAIFCLCLPAIVGVGCLAMSVSTASYEYV